MNVRSIIIGIIVVVIIVALGLTLAKRFPQVSFLDIFKSKFNVASSPTPTLAPTNVPVTQAPPSGLGGGSMIFCTPELTTPSCQGASSTPVCGYQRTVKADGSAVEAKLTYNNACYFCSLFGQNGVLNMGDSKVYSLGYQNGACQ